MAGAEKRVNDQIIKFPNSFILFNILGAILSEQGQLDKAVEKYKQSVKMNPSYAEGYNNLGTAFQRMGKINEAIDSYKKAISLKSEFSEAFNNLGNAVIETNRLRDSIH